MKMKFFRVNIADIDSFEDYYDVVCEIPESVISKSQTDTQIIQNILDYHTEMKDELEEGHSGISSVKEISQDEYELNSLNSF